MFFDVKFDEFINQPIKQVRLIYSHLGFNFEEKTERSMINYVEEFKKEEKIKHSYGLNEFGLSKESVQNALSKYLKF